MLLSLVAACAPAKFIHFETGTGTDGAPLSIELQPVECRREAEGPRKSRVNHGPIVLSITNNSREVMTLDWDRWFFVDADNRSHHIVHAGTGDWNERDDARQTPSTIAPGATIEDAIYSKDAIDEGGAGFRFTPFLTCDESGVGTRYRLVVSFKTQAQEQDLEFPLKVRDVTQVR